MSTVIPSLKDRSDQMRERVLEVAEDYGLEIEDELDEVGVKYLGTYVNAQASKQGPNFRVDFDSTNFFKMDEERQRRTILHELIHIKQFNNSLSEWAQDEFDASDELAEKLDGTIWEDVRSIEGETELILSNFFPEEESTYPYAQSRKEKEFEGIDLDSELDIEDEAEEILDEYREIDESWEEDGLYIEEGQFNGEDYTIAVLGTEKAEEKAEDYIISNINYEAESQDYTTQSNYAMNSLAV